jgi:hypothetical protein
MLFLLRGDAEMRFLFISQGQKAVKDRGVLVIVLSGGHGKRMGYFSISCSKISYDEYLLF